MAGSLNGKLRRWTARSAFAAFATLAVASAAQAQSLLPLGAAPPGEIMERLRAEGFVLSGPLYRRNSVYLADVNGGPAGHERLIIDAWSGEILQRFIVRRGHWRQGLGGEFAEPLPPGITGPPPASEFYDRSPAGAAEEPMKPALKHRPAAASRQPAQTAPAADANPASPATAPAIPQSTATAPPAAPPATDTPSAPKLDAPPAPAEKAEAASAPDASSGAATQEAPKPDAKPAAPVQAEQTKSGAVAPAEAQAAREASPKPAVPSARARPGDKSKPNDVPVMPLE